MADSIVVNKTRSIERCLLRIVEDYSGQEADFETNFMRQDAVLLNLQRACELSPDLENHFIKSLKLGVPQNSKDTFEILEKEQVIPNELAARLSSMVGFRYIAAHDYAKLDIKIVKNMLDNRLDDFRDFVKTALQYA